MDEKERRRELIRLWRENNRTHVRAYTREYMRKYRASDITPQKITTPADIEAWWRART